MTTSPSTAERAQEAAGTAAEQGKHVAGTAKQEAQTVASEAAGQARSVVNDALGQVTDQSKQQKDRLAGTLQTFGDDLESMASSGSGLATDVAKQVASQVRSIASHLETREPTELLDDVRRFARQRPGAFLIGALAAGVVAGRVLRGTADGIAAATAAPSTGTTGLGTDVPAGSSGFAGMSGTADYAGTTDTTSYGTTGTGGFTGADEAQPTYSPSPSTESGTSHGQPTMDTPTSAPMARPEAGYGERGVLGDEGGLR